MTTPAIHSASNPRFKLALKLREHKARLRQQRFLVEGIAELTLALKSSLVWDELFVCEAYLQQPAARQVRREFEQLGVATFLLETSLWDRLAYGNRHEGLLATAHMPNVELEDVPLPDRPLVVVLDRVEKPGNIGAVIRTADAAGAHAVVVADGTRDLYNPNIVRASLGSVFTLPVVAAGAEEVIAWLRRHGIAAWVAAVDAPTTYFAANLLAGSALVLGSEAGGVGPRWRQPEMPTLSIPMSGRVDSLNVSVTAALLLYEAVRQRAGGSDSADRPAPP